MTGTAARLQSLNICSSVSDPDPHKEMPPGSGSPWTDADPDPGGKKPRKYTGSLGEYRTGRIKVRILL